MRTPARKSTRVPGHGPASRYELPCTGHERMPRGTRMCHAGPGMDARIQRYELRKTEVKCGATVDSGLGPDFTPVAMDDALDGGKADARARNLSLRMQALEGAEEPGGVARVEAGAVVANEIDGPAGAVDT